MLWFAMLVAPALVAYWVWSVIVCQMLFFLIRPSVERGMWVLLSYLFTLGGSSGWTYDGGPVWITWLTYTIIPLMFLHTLLRPHQKFNSRILIPLIFLCIISGLSAWINQANWVHVLAWWAHFLRYPILFLLLISLPINFSTYKVWIKAYMGLALLQIPTTVLKFVFVTENVDAIFGTMHGGLTGNMGLAVLVGICIALGLGLSNKNESKYILVALGLFVPLIVGSVNFPLLMGVVVGIWIILDWGVKYLISIIKVKRKFIYIFIVGILAIFPIMGSILAMPKSQTSELQQLLEGQFNNPRTYEAFVNPDLSFVPYSSRQMFIATTVEWFRQNPSDLLLGSIGPRIGLGHQAGKLSNAKDGLSPIAHINEAVGVPVTMTQYSVQLPRTLLEVGLIGLIGFWWLFWSVRPGRKVLQDARLDPWLAGLVLGFGGIWWLQVLLCVLYADIWRIDHLNFGFWLCAAALYRRPTHKQDETVPALTSL